MSDHLPEISGPRGHDKGWTNENLSLVKRVRSGKRTGHTQVHGPWWGKLTCVDGTLIGHWKATMGNLCSVMLIISFNTQYEVKVQNMVVSQRQAQLVLRPCSEHGSWCPSLWTKYSTPKMWTELLVTGSPRAQCTPLPCRTHIQPLLHLRFKSMFAAKCLLLFS